MLHELQTDDLIIQKFKLDVCVEFNDGTNTFNYVLLFMVEYLMDYSIQILFLFFLYSYNNCI